MFDVDGTLVDSNYLHVVAWMGAFRESGQHVDGAAIHRAIGLGSAQLLEKLLGREVAATIGDQVKARHASLYGRNFETLRPFDGARPLIRAVAERARVALATSASSAELAALRAALDVDDVVDVIIGSEEVETAKPEPDLVEAALQRTGVACDQAVFVGDTIWDIEAAGRAGVACVAVLTGGISRTELLTAGAIDVYPSVAELLAGIDDSPLSRVLQ